MSAELLRRAAEKLREHANAASPGPWDYNSYSAILSGPKVIPYDEWDCGEHELERREPCGACGSATGCSLAAEEYSRDPLVASVPSYAGDTAHGQHAADASLIELMHPPVALAFAEWLDAEADGHAAVQGVGQVVGALMVQMSSTEFGAQIKHSTLPQAVAVARAILREES